MKNKDLLIIPTPKELLSDTEALVYVPVTPEIVCTADILLPAAQALADYAARLHGVELTFGKGGVSLTLDESLAEGEYRLEITEQGARAFASEPIGAHYAVASILQLMRVEEGVTLPLLSIADRPECSYRALMVDLARKWHEFSTLFEYVDLCYFYKVRFLHLHFIDTQSYTLPSEKFPKMPTEGRHYTREQIAELNAYAYSRGIELIPELEVPGHAAAMVNAYPELFANSMDSENVVDTYALFNNTGKNNVICVGRPDIMDTLRVLAEEVIEMFPNSRYLHIGGDEAKIADWEHCHECKKYMSEHGLSGVKALYTDFIKRMTDMVLELGRTPIVWEGFPREGAEQISRKVVVTAWESYYHLADELVDEGFNIINASWEPLYIVPEGHRVVKSGRWTPEEVLEWNIYTWKNWNKKTVAHLNPIHLQPTKQVMGGQLCSWENTYEGDIRAIRENLAALSERTWSVRRLVEDDEFRARLERLLPLAEKLAR